MPLAVSGTTTQPKQRQRPNLIGTPTDKVGKALTSLVSKVPFPNEEGIVGSIKGAIQGAADWMGNLPLPIMDRGRAEAIRSMARAISGAVRSHTLDSAAAGAAVYTPSVEIDPVTGKKSITKVELLDKDTRMKRAMEFAQAQKEISEVPIPPHVQEANDAVGREDWTGMAEAIAKNPFEVIGYYGTQSFARNPTAAIVGFVPVLGTIYGSYTAEQRAGLSERITKAMQSRGWDPTSAKDVYQAFSDPNLLREAYDVASKGAKALTAAEVAVEIATFGLSRKILPGGAGAGLIRGLVTFAGEAVGETAGEATKQLVTDGSVNMVEATLEGLTALGQNLATTVGHTNLHEALDRVPVFPKTGEEAQFKIDQAMFMLQDEGFSEEEAFHVIMDAGQVDENMHDRGATSLVRYDVEKWRSSSRKTKRAVNELRQILSNSPFVSTDEYHVAGIPPKLFSLKKQQQEPPPITPESQAVHAEIKNKFTTVDPKTPREGPLLGFILPDGTVIDTEAGDHVEALDRLGLFEPTKEESEDFDEIEVSERFMEAHGIVRMRADLHGPSGAQTESTAIRTYGPVTDAQKRAISQLAGSSARVTLETGVPGAPSAHSSLTEANPGRVRRSLEGILSETFGTEELDLSNETYETFGAHPELEENEVAVGIPDKENVTAVAIIEARQLAGSNKYKPRTILGEDLGVFDSPEEAMQAVEDHFKNPEKRTKANEILAQQGDMLQQRLDKSLAAIKEEKATKSEASNLKNELPEMTEQDVANFTGISRAVIARARRMRGSAVQDPSQRRPIYNSIISAIQQGYHLDALDYAQTILARVQKGEWVEIDQDRQSGLLVAKAQREQKYTQMMNQIEQLRLAGDDAAAVEVLNRANNLLGEMETIEDGLAAIGTVAGRTLGMRKYMYDRDTFTIANVMNQARRAKGRDLTLEETERYQKAVVTIQRLQAKVKDLAENSIKPEQEARLLELITEIHKATAKQVQEEMKGMKKSDILKEREEAQQRLRDLMNDARMGLDPRWLAEMAKIAKTYIAEGVLEVEDLAKRLMDLSPSIQRADALEAILMVSEFTEGDKEIQKELDAEQQVAEEWAKLNRKDPEEAKRILAKMQQVMQGSQFSLDKEKARMLREIDKLRRELAGSIGPPKEKKKVITDPEYRAIRKTLLELRAAKRARQEAARLKNMDQVELEDWIARFRSKREGKTKRKIPATDELRDAQIELQLARKALTREALSGRKLGVKDIIPEFNAIRKTFQATADVSGILRQGLGLIVAYPNQALFGQIVDPTTGQKVSPVAEAFKVYFSRNRHEAVDLLMQEHPNYKTMLEYHLDLTAAGESISEAEEYFSSELIRRIPGMSEVWGQMQNRDRSLARKVALTPVAAGRSIIAGSERSMVTFLNLMRMSVMDQALDPNLALDDDALFAIAQFINESSGRGTLKPGTAKILNNVFFAPRFAVSRFQVLGRQIATGGGIAVSKETNPFLRQAIMRQAVGMVGLGVSMLGLAKLGGAEVGDDPRDSDWGKIIIGNTRIDIWGGFQQPASLIARLLYGTGAAHEIFEDDPSILSNPRDLVNNFGHFKASPAVSAFFELTSGKTAVGERISPADVVFGKDNLPFWINDAVEAYKAQGAIIGTAASVAAIAGMGVSTYGTATQSGDLKPIVRAGGYKLTPPRYNEATSDDPELKGQLNEVFHMLVAKRMRANLDYLKQLEKEGKKGKPILNQLLKEYSADTREVMKDFLPKPQSESPVPEASIDALRRLVETE